MPSPMTKIMNGISSSKLQAMLPARSSSAGVKAEPMATPNTARMGMAKGLGRSIGAPMTEATRQAVSAPRNHGSGN